MLEKEPEIRKELQHIWEKESATFPPPVRWRRDRWEAIVSDDNKFIHVSTSRGVMINDLSEPYYAKRFVYGGRVIR